MPDRQWNPRSSPLYWVVMVVVAVVVLILGFT